MKRRIWFGCCLVIFILILAFDLWAAEWTQKTPANFPSSRNECGMAYDSARGETILFGGIGGATKGDTWSWDGAQWSLITNSGPSPRFDMAMAYDSKRNVIVLFGGYLYNSPTYYNDTWEWDGSSWSQVATTGPSPRRGARMAFDSNRGVMVLFGGQAGSDPFSDTWEWDGTNWNNIITTGPSARHYYSMAYDVATGQTVLFGGCEANKCTFIGNPEQKNDTWGWDGLNWVQLANTGPPTRKRMDMVYDNDRGVIILYGGECGGCAPDRFEDTWEWNGTSWKQVNVVGPFERGAHNMAYDSIRKVIVLYGGWDSAYLRDTWEFESLPLSMTIPATADEDDGTIQGTVAIPASLPDDLAITLSSNDTSKVTVPATVMIISGQNFIDFNLSIINDNLPGGGKSVTITASAAGWIFADDTITIFEDDYTNYPGGGG